MNSQFLTNYTETTFLQTIKDNLRTCHSFLFSVSFIKYAGLVLLKKDLEAALERGVTGKLITSTYQNFTDIKSLNSFLELQNRFPKFECHLDRECFHDDGYSTLGYHSKGYLFTFDDYCEVIIGSSNITRFALLKNVEWDLVVRELLNSGVFNEAKAEFDDKWNQTLPLTQELIKEYSVKLDYAIERWDMDYDQASVAVKPNYMQKNALKELNRYRAAGVDKALVIASPGSGKSYL
ncbi:MAG: hypothetical protein HUJ54_11645, partial [Erysipelotrichaceae bacterium]|nr:hypothetical protein [Erysipelotrichaceae bacterium]